MYYDDNESIDALTGRNRVDKTKSNPPHSVWEDITGYQAKWNQGINETHSVMQIFMHEEDEGLGLWLCHLREVQRRPLSLQQVPNRPASSGSFKAETSLDTINDSTTDT